jgi:ribosomal-protein-alanine N-acetyltransferase
MSLPNLHTNRLLLRPFVLEDAAEVQRLAGEKIIADMTAAVPHPYLDGMAESWIATHQDAYEANKELTLAITCKAEEKLIGAISLLSISAPHQRAELGYWVGKDYWNQGFCSEAAKALINFGFDQLRLNRICARCYGTNLASIKVMERSGMRHEGRQREHERKEHHFEDVVLYAVLKSDWAQASNMTLDADSQRRSA